MMTAEKGVSSTVVSGNSNNSCDSEQNKEAAISVVSNIALNPYVTNTNPPTTLVCLPTIVSVSNSNAQVQNQQFHLSLAPATSNHIITTRDGMKTTTAVSYLTSLTMLIARVHYGNHIHFLHLSLAYCNNCKTNHTTTANPAKY